MAQVLVTGISGFIAKHVARDLLAAGHAVRGTVRSPEKAAAVRATLADAGVDVARLDFATADLEGDDGWAEAVAGCDYVQHVASPFPLRQPRGREALSPAAKEGALRVARAARSAGVKRVVVTSSMVAMMYRGGRPAKMQVTESDWTDPDWPPATPYIISKTRAERALWDDADAHGDRERLVAINPGFVLGPALDREIGASLDVVRLIMTGAYPAMPAITFPVVDVRDLAALHVKAMEAASVGGRRLIGSADSLSMRGMALALKEAYPAYARRIPTGELPDGLVRLIAAFDPTLKTVLADLGTAPEARAGYVTELTGVAFRPAREAVIAAGASLIERGIV